jgi:DNA-binding response OmpR family regulator/two-component sensor histidine kinase
MKLQASEENMVELVKNYVQQFESLAKQKKIDLIFKSEREVILVFVNREKIEIILYNLLSNAFKFTQEGGKIEVATGIVSAPPLSPPYRVEGYFIVPPDLGGATGGAGKVECVMVSVIDTGIGIPNDQLPHIFDRFYQVGDSYTKDQEGTGIGLALTKELVELHHGQIEVESEGWIGTTFRIYLPLGKEHLKTEDIVGSRQLTVSRETPKRDKRKAISEDFEPVTCNPNLNRDFASLNLQPATDTLPKDAPILLIVEDNADLRLYLRGYLEQTYSVIEAADGQQGLDRAIEHIPDLVLSDVMMPEMDGYKLSKKLKTDERTSHIPIILLTARASIESKIEGLETGADDFITKPFDQHELLVRIQNLITQRKKLKEHYLQEIGIADLAVKEKSGETEFISLDQKFLRKAKTVIENHLSDNEFDVMQFGDEMNLSRTQLHRKLRALINQSASEFIRTIRLNYARILLTNKTGNISEIALEVGFTNPSYFSECFRKQFGLTPSEFVNPKFQAPKSK